MNVLIVDDDEDIREAVAEIVRDLGFQPKMCSNGIEALKSLESGEYLLMFLDLIMPEMGGVETLSEIKKKGIEINTVVLSGHFSKDVKDHCKKYGAKRFLEKPVESSDIEVILKSESKRNKSYENQAIDDVFS